jgi:transposase
MTFYIGVDFHARQQTICYFDTADGELKQAELHHQQDDIRAFYKSFSGDVIVGIEASGYSLWFEELLEELGHQVWIGDASEIRRLAKRRQKNDRRDAEHILELLTRDEFPRLHRQLPTSREVLRQLRYRHRLVKMTTMIKNSLHAISLAAGLSLKSTIRSAKGQALLQGLRLSPALTHQRDEWLLLLETLNRKIKEVEGWLRLQAQDDERVVRLQTHPGIGLLTALALVHTLEPAARFSSTRKVVAYIGLDPMEYSSAERKRYGRISKAGSRLLRFLLGEAAHKAIHTDTELRSFYYRLLKKKETSRAIVSVARKLLVRSFIMLRDKIDYQEFKARGVECKSSYQMPNGKYLMLTLRTGKY